MSSSLIFHPVSKRRWKEFNKGGYYRPEGTKYEDGIICVNADKLKAYINQHFHGRRQVLVLVIDKSRLRERLVYSKEKENYTVEHQINMDAILDKIDLRSNKEGLFDIEVSED